MISLTENKAFWSFTLVFSPGTWQHLAIRIKFAYKQTGYDRHPAYYKSVWQKTLNSYQIWTLQTEVLNENTKRKCLRLTAVLCDLSVDLQVWGSGETKRRSPGSYHGAGSRQDRGQWYSYHWIQGPLHKGGTKCLHCALLTFHVM